ncbi:16S rRNA (guanine(527)-N(7))-methyltransferase RsmG [Pseudoponticoccus marisrubri]|uniref:Ribosomal RNA small subunit methyltransferase G n=1 Tax=Pseudoponticoccus marisrubri TaxID=1685382 RepID=A0A0W7WGF1_9RHOB|nr:16S rRNA (guanine(527)-N(7))-methyltransferase RsmG [Pseudoponticoccus marisrubri]KUF09572.1 hypothetical protein AVJ23_16955 [Pseudoponticoccus marisrubri]
MRELSSVLAGSVSRETEERLHELLALLRKWNPAINLVSRSTLDDAWTRHILDSAQILNHAPANPTSWADLGSGGGFPGLVVACILAEWSPETTVSLIESDTRKASFLRRASGALSLNTEVLAKRIEDVAPRNAQVLSARALAPLPNLLTHVHRHLSAEGTALLMKGSGHRSEIADAERSWHFTCRAHPSKTDPHAVILQIEELSNV